MESVIEKNGSFLFVRLAPGEELFDGILKACSDAGVKYGTIVSCIGSLSQTTYTMPRDEPKSITKIAYRDLMVASRPSELICAQGTIGSSEGGPDMHMHALMVDADGRLFAGHMAKGCIICATMEICIAVTESGEFVREYDETLHFSLFHMMSKTHAGHR